MKARNLRWSVLLAGTAILGACQVSSIVSERSPADPYKEDPTAVARGGAIFKSVCSGYCHQLTPTTSDALFLFDCTWKHGDTDQEIFQIITTGVPNTRMVGFADNLPEGYQDTWRIVAWLRHNSRCDDP